MNNKILFITIISLLQISLFSSIILGMNSDCGDKIVKCYDRNNNEIIGQTCQQNNECLDNITLMGAIILGSLIFIVVNIMLFRVHYEI